jgi:hypothetical protein
LCVVDGELPTDFESVLATLAEPSPGAQLFLCQKKASKHGARAEPIAIPGLADRVAELDLIVREYGAEAMTAMEVAGEIKAEDKAWVVKNCIDSLVDIEKGTMRIVALRRYGSKSAAAKALGMSQVALGKWVRNRSPLPFKIGA